MATVELSAGPAKVVVDADAGGRIASVSVAGLELLVGAAEGGQSPTRWGMFPMAPWTGRIRRGRFRWGGQVYRLPINSPPHAIHGTVHVQAWVLEDHGADWCRLSCPFGPDWPLGGHATQVVRMDAGGVDFLLEVHAADEAMPGACGWHPWFRRHLGIGGELELEVALGERWQRDDDGIPSGDLVAPGTPPPEGWDDCFSVDGAPVATLRWPGAVDLRIESSCPNVVVFTQPAHAVCVEPETGPPDALNLGPEVVRPGRPLAARMRWSWTLG